MPLWDKAGRLSIGCKAFQGIRACSGFFWPIVRPMEFDLFARASCIASASSNLVISRHVRKTKTVPRPAPLGASGGFFVTVKTRVFCSARGPGGSARNGCAGTPSRAPLGCHPTPLHPLRWGAQRHPQGACRHEKGHPRGGLPVNGERATRPLVGSWPARPSVCTAGR